MIGGFCPLVNPATRVSEVNLEATRKERQELHREVRIRNYIGWLFANSLPGEEWVRVTVDDAEEGPEAA